jgi:hypothetical protein
MTMTNLDDYMVNYDDRHSLFTRVAGESGVVIVPLVQLSNALPVPHGTVQEVPLEPHINYLALARITVANAMGAEADQVTILTADEVNRLPQGTSLLTTLADDAGAGYMSRQLADMGDVTAFHKSRPVPTLAQLQVMRERGVTPHIIHRADGTRLFIGATDANGDNVDNDCAPL